MARLLFGEKFVDENCVLINLINANSPMVYDETMLGALKAYARAGQACVVSPFILSGDLRMTFAEVNARVNDLAGGLAARGLGPGERLAFFMNSGPEVIFLALAVNKLGAIWVPVNTDYKGAWLEDTIVRSRPHVLVTDSEHAGRLAEVRDRLDVEHILVQGDAGVLTGAEPLADAYLPGSPEPDMSGFSYGDTCAVLWTSGSAA